MKDIRAFSLSLYGIRKDNLFLPFTIFILVTIFIARLFVISFPGLKVYIYDYQFYHFFGGILIIILMCQLLMFADDTEERHCKFTLLMSIGIGLIIDQAIYLIVKEKTQLGYWEIPSVLGAIICFFIILIFSGGIKLYQGLIKLQSKKKEINNKDTNIIIESFLNRHPKISLIVFLSFFFLAFIGARYYLLAHPEASAMINGYEIHHLYFGLIGIIASGIIFAFPPNIQIHSFKSKGLGGQIIKIIVICMKVIPIMVMAGGIGFVVDEYVFLVMGGITDEDYWSAPSLFGAIIFAIIVVFTSIILHLQSNKFRRNPSKG